jgi:hypothetical protein
MPTYEFVSFFISTPKREEGQGGLIGKLASPSLVKTSLVVYSRADTRMYILL